MYKYNFNKTKIVAVVGDDFKKEDIETFEEHGIDTEGLQITVRIICIPKGITRSNKKHILNCNCPTKNFIAFLTINQVEICTKKPIAQKMVLFVM